MQWLYVTECDRHLCAAVSRLKCRLYHSDHLDDEKKPSKQKQPFCSRLNNAAMSLVNTKPMTT